VISHELAAIKNERCNLAHDLFPMPLYCVQGRSAKAQPTCNPHHCLWYTWRDSWHDDSISKSVVSGIDVLIAGLLRCLGRF